MASRRRARQRRRRDLRAVLPARLDVDLDGARLTVVHNGGPDRGASSACGASSPPPDAVVFGTRTSRCTNRPDGFRSSTPGSPTEKRRAPTHTMGLAHAAEGRITSR